MGFEPAPLRNRPGRLNKYKKNRIKKDQVRAELYRRGFRINFRNVGQREVVTYKS